MDREKVIKGVEEISDYFFSVYRHSKDREEINEAKDRCDAVEDALALLKEQEVKNVVNMTLSKDCFLIASCPKCNALLTRVEHKNYCGYCGQAVKWE